MAWLRTCWIYPERLPAGLTHLSLPILCNDAATGLFRCFATSRDALNRSVPVTSLVDLDGDCRLRVLHDWELVAQPGLPGYFDEAGLALSHVRPIRDGFACMTFGWRLRKRGGWFNEIGSLILDQGGRVRERSQAPIMSRGTLDPISMAYPFRRANGDILYCAPTGLDEVTGLPLDFRILSAEGSRRDVRRVIAEPQRLRIPGIYALTRPWQAEFSGRHYLWVSIRGEKYRIVRVELAKGGEPISNQGIVEELSGMNNEMESGSACYSSLFEWNRKLLMLYNGSKYGLSGFGVATQRVSEIA